MTRTTLTSATPGPITGDDYMDNVAEHVRRFWNVSALPLTSVGGTANAVTATLTPALLAGLVEGMKFTLTWGAANTGAVTLSLNGATAVAVLDASGSALAGGEVGAGVRSLVEYVGSAFRILTSAGSSSGPGPYHIAFTASGTWTVPTGYDADTPYRIEAWGGGGGGDGDGGGGGGGAYSERRGRYGDLSSSYTVTIGAGGAVEANGGVTTVGSLLTAYAGARGTGSSGSPVGGGGGGEFASGSTSTGGSIGGGKGSYEPGSGYVAAEDARSLWGGGGGGAWTSNPDGGRAIFGGGGGTRAGGTAGASLRGGSGGADGVAGSAPGGGGGKNAAGARGEVRIWIG